VGFEVVATSPVRGPDDFDWGRLRLDGAHDDTALFFRCRDVDGAYAHLRGRGLDLAPPKVAPYGMKQLYLKDPDGYAICFQCPAPAAG
jgi:hypothetical protein